ncbi:MAG: heavy metal-binding domain-containing protein [Paracoccaceae bacterium]
MIVTTEKFVGDVERLGIVASDVVLGMNIFKDFLANVRDVVGGRSGTVQKTFEDARNMAFEDVKIKAAHLGANAVIAVDISYHSISTGSAVNMMMVSVNGTAVKWQ